MAVMPIIIMRAPITRVIADASMSRAIIGVAAEEAEAVLEAEAAGESATSIDRDRDYRVTRILPDAPQGLSRIGFALSARFAVPVLGLPAISFAAGHPAFINTPELILRFGVS
jgi:hypothetical protein